MENLVRLLHFLFKLVTNDFLQLSTSSFEKEHFTVLFKSNLLHGLKGSLCV